MPDKFCEYCGAAMQPDDLFCSSCGQKPSGSGKEKGGYSNGTGNLLVTQEKEQPEIMLQPQTQLPGNQSFEQMLQPPIQQTYSWQPPVQNNPFTRFSGEMNTEVRQKKTMGRGIILGSVIVMIIFSAIITGIILTVHKPTTKTQSSVGAVGIQQEISSASTINFNQPNSLVDIQNVKKDAVLSEIAGKWAGEMQLIRMDGYDSLPPDERPENFKEIISQALATPAPMTLEIEDDGNWDIDVDLMEGIRMGSNEYDRERFPVSPLLIPALKEGSFDVTHGDTEDGAAMQIKLSGVVTQESEGLSIQGIFMLSMKRGNIDAVMEGRYIISPVA